MSRGHGVPLAVRRVVAGRGRIVIRRAETHDFSALGRLIQLADRPALPDPVLLAESDGQLVAAVSTATGESAADPFVATADVIALLELRARQLDSAA